MPADSVNNNQAALSRWTGSLACPACLGVLRDEDTVIVCSTCGRRYPVIDGIPVLITDRATTPDIG
jgi:uncharacterized protein YbaR (Trm112 family)